LFLRCFLEMSYVLGIDLGTSSVKIVLVNVGGKIIAASSEGYRTYSPHPGWAEQEPEEWWKATVRAINRVINQTHIDLEQIRGVGLSGQTHGAVILDKNLLPLRKAIIWMDKRSISQVHGLEERMGGRLPRVTGLPISTGFMAPSLLWIKENQPSLWKRIYKVLLPKDYLRLKLTGVAASDVTDAGGTLLLDTAKRKWSREIIDELNIPYAFFPSLYESSQISGQVTGKAAKEISLKEKTPVLAGGADQVMAAIGNGVVAEGRIASSIGTGALLTTCTDHPIIKPDRVLHAIPHALPGKWILMGAILAGGSCLDWFFDQIILEGEISSQSNSRRFISSSISSTSAASKGLLFLPYLGGERTPYLDPQARGAFIGLSFHHSQKDLVRAIMEGVVFALRDCLEEFKKAGIKPSYITAGGGGARSKVWRQIQADIFDLSVFTTNAKESSAYGASLIAAVGTGVFPTVEKACQQWVRKENETIPNLQEVELYEKIYQVYHSLYPKLKEDFHTLSGYSIGSG